MIPHVIHTFWLSSEPMLPEVKDNIATWSKVNPDFEIRVHTMDEMVRYYRRCQWLRSMLELKAWAYASDYLRSVVLRDQGGVYFDGDVRCHKPLAPIIDDGRTRLIGYEAARENRIECAVMAFEKGEPLMRLMAAHYEKWKEGEPIHTMPHVMQIVVRNNGQSLADALPKEVLSGQLVGRRSESWTIEATPQSITTHHYTHTGYGPQTRPSR